MSIANAITNKRQSQDAADHATMPSIQDIIQEVSQQLAMVWPLKDYVAVNPYFGLADQPFLAARQKLQSVSDMELFMPVAYYQDQFARGCFTKSEINAAIDELVSDGVAGAERIDVNQVLNLLTQNVGESPTSDSSFDKSNNPGRSLFTLAELIDRDSGTRWCRKIRDEISKHCAAHYDQGQAIWPSPWRELPLYQAWQSAMQHDRAFETQGVSGFRKFATALPHNPHAALAELLDRLGVPPTLWADLLLCEAQAIPGWCAWTKYQQREAEHRGENSSDFAGLLAMQLAYQVALANHVDFQVEWSSVAAQCLDSKRSTQAQDDELLRYALLKSTEIAFRNRLVKNLKDSPDSSPQLERPAQGLAQMVFCIDVRSERIRRHLETASSEIETFGFAGFFGLPIEIVELGAETGTSQVPVLIKPHFKVQEELDVADTSENNAAVSRRTSMRFVRKTWKEFQASAVSMFAFVETTGLFYGFKLLARATGFNRVWQSRFDGVSLADRHCLAPSLRGLHQQGITASMQVDMAESILRGIGIVDDFARLVVFCGHSSQTENNPLQAGLDCGACGGHSGEANARFAAKLLNQKFIRQALVERGISIPDQTWFVGALHNTTTDELNFFDTHRLPETHLDDLSQLETIAKPASQRTRAERLSLLPGRSTLDLIRRSQDWSEVRPEWGLAGNAAFIAAPREITESISLDGRSFLHSYDYRQDTGFRVLEQIMTAPMIVANWINMQYYASTVDPVHFGSGNKTVHNVVGRFGLFSGNGGDLMTGLPWQSIHDGRDYQHHPLRLLVIIAAPRDAIADVIAKHEVVANLVTNGWLHLVAIDDCRYYRFTEQQRWDALLSGECQSIEQLV